MAVAQIVFAAAMDGNAPLIGASPINKEFINATSTSQVATIAFPALQGGAQRLVCQITASGGDIWVKFGAGTPVASQGNDWLITSGQTREFGIVSEGFKVAVINA